MEYISKNQFKELIDSKLKYDDYYIVLFGASNFGEKFVNYLNFYGLSAKYFCDNDSTKWGKKLCNIPIKSPEVLKKDKKMILFITSTANWVSEIANQLTNIDVGNIYYYNIFFYSDDVENVIKQYKKEMFSITKCNDLIGDIIRKGLPSMISRVGTVETSLIMYDLENNNLLRNKLTENNNGKYTNPDEEIRLEQVIRMTQKNAGIFPVTYDGIHEFVKEYLKYMPEADVMGVWKTDFEGRLLNKVCRNDCVFAELDSLMPIKIKNPWTRELKGKKVLVIHPCKDTIISQYNKRELLFNNQEVLPEFNIEVLKAVNSAGDNKCQFDTWKDALNYMYKQIDKIDFDIALIGAGAYGLPLAGYIKEKGKIAVHIGGALQLLFGIKGYRWDDYGVYNENWIRPLEHERPMGFKKIEGGCYW